MSKMLLSAHPKIFLLLKKMLGTVKYAIPFVATAFIAQEAKGQVFVYPSGVLNPFLSPDNTVQAQAYNSLNLLTQTSERNSSIDAIIKGGRVQTILPNPNPLWNCSNWTLLQIVNSYEDMKEGVYYGNELMFDGYRDFVLQDIYIHGGTLADAGKNGLPMFDLSLSDPVTLPSGHGMNLVFSGNNVFVQGDRDAIESRSGATQVQPGEENIPMNCEFAIIGYPYLFKNSSHEKNYWTFKIFEFKIVNGEYILTYNVNEDPNFNTRFRVITQRESDAPTIDIKQGTAPDSLVCTINDENLKSVWYTVDGGAKIPLMTEVLPQVREKKVALKMNLPTGTHQIKIGADDYFRLLTEKNEQRIIPVNNPPVITILSPVEGAIYDKDIALEYNITDDDFASAWYSLDNGVTKIPAGKSGTIQLQLSDGLQKILMEATDQKPQTTSKTINFEINRPPTINITTPAEGAVYDKNISLVYAITDKDFASAWYSLDGGTTKITLAQSGTIPLTLANGKYTLLMEATDLRPQSSNATRSFEMKITTGIEDQAPKKEIIVYPNPVKDYIIIEYNLPSGGQVLTEIFNQGGSLVWSAREEISPGMTNRLDMTSLPGGIYLISITTSTQTYTFPLMVNQ